MARTTGIDAVTRAPEAKGIPYYLPATVVPVKIKGEFVTIDTKKAKDNPDDGTNYEYTLSMEMLPPLQVADPNALVFLEYDESVFSDDTYTLTVGSNGLLTTVNLTSTDRSGDILKALAELAKTALKIPLAFSSAGALKGVEKDGDARRNACWQTLRPFEATINLPITEFLTGPIGSNFKIVPEPDGANAMLTALLFKPGEPLPDGLEILSAEFKGVPKPPTQNDKEEGDKVARTTAPNGVVFRVLESGLLSLTVGGTAIAGERSVPFQRVSIDPKTKAETVTEVLVPCEIRMSPKSISDVPIQAANPHTTFVAAVNRGFLVKKTVNLAVTDGILTGVVVDKPSQVLAAVNLPVDIIKALVSIPGELLSFKVQQIQDQQKLTDAEAQAIEAQVKLLEAIEKLKAAQATPPTQP